MENQEACNTIRKRQWNQSEIALKWWSEKRLKLEEQKLIQDERDELRKEVNTLLCLNWTNLRYVIGHSVQRREIWSE
jgi:hypothetical protein